MINLLKNIIKLKGHEKEVYCIKFTKDGKFAASGGVENKIIVWNIDKKSIFHTFSGHTKFIWDLFIINDDMHIVSTGIRNEFIVWSIK